MLIGLISDTHDNIANIMKAVEIFKERKVDFVLHLGDVVAPATIRFFKGVKLKVLKGNCDGDIENMRLRLKDIEGEHLGAGWEAELDGKKIAAIHGDNQLRLEQLIASKQHDYVFHGHTHIRRDERLGKTRVINPGAHYWQSEGTIALLDVERDRLEFIIL